MAQHSLWFSLSTSSILSTRAITYDAGNRVTYEADITNGTDSNNNAVTYTSNITNHYRLYSSATGTYSGTDQGVLVHSLNSQTQSTSNGQPVTTNTMYSYVWWGQARQDTVTVYGSDPNNSNATQWLPGTAIYHYDANGNLTQVNDGDGTASYNRIVSYQTNLLGQVLNRSETNYGRAGAQRRFFYLNGEAVGDVGTDALPSDIDYAQQLAPLLHRKCRGSYRPVNADFHPGETAAKGAAAEVELRRPIYTVRVPQIFFSARARSSGLRSDLSRASTARASWLLMSLPIMEASCSHSDSRRTFSAKSMCGARAPAKSIRC